MTKKIEYMREPGAHELGVLSSGLTSALPPTMTPVETFGFFYRDNDGSIIAGATGCLMFGSAYTDLLWVSPAVRGRGYGRNLMRAGEDLGRSRECTFAAVNTFSFQALDFYRKLGYVVDFERGGYANGATNYYLTKKLDP